MAEPRRAVLHLAAAADYLGTTPKALRCRIARGLVPYRSLGSRIIFVQQELDQFLLRLPGVSLDEARHNLEVRR